MFMTSKNSDSFDSQVVEQRVMQWLQDVVIGLNLCPFANKPTRAGQVRLRVSEALNEEALLMDVEAELQRLDAEPVATLETTLVIAPQVLTDFWDFNQFIGWVEALINRNGWQGVYQLATFHPNYCFAGAEPEDAENLTNRAPYPILHLIREASMAEVLARHPDPESIPEDNIRRVNALSEDERRNLFPYLLGQ